MRIITTVTALVALSASTVSAKSLEDMLVDKGALNKAEAAMVDGKVMWKNGTRVEYPSTGVTTTISTLVQPRYDFTDGDGDFGEGNSSSFNVHRARLILDGTAMHEEFRYQLEADFSGNDDLSRFQTGTRSPVLLNAFVEWQACDWSSLRFGQFKTMYSRQFQSNPWALQFADNSIATDYFALGRGQGASATGNFADGAFQVSAGIFNGISTGENINSIGVDTKHTGVLSLRFNAAGNMNPWEEGDVDMSQDLAANFGFSYAFSDGNIARPVSGMTDTFIVDPTEIHHFSADANFKYQGFSFHGEFYYANIDQDSSANRVKPLGFYAQAGYFLNDDWELALRYSMVDCDDGAACAGDKFQEASGTINYYFWKHNLKAQFGYSNISRDIDTDDDQKTNRWTFMLTAMI